MTKDEQSKFEKEFFEELKGNIDLKKEELLLGSFFKEPIWWFVPDFKENPDISEEAIIKNCREMKKCSPNKRFLCTKSFFTALRKSKKTKEIEFFRCLGNMRGFVYPIVHKNRILGYISMCHAKREIPPVATKMFTGFVNALSKEILRKLELAKLHETIKPRAIALSTVHTVHRILSSTLDLEELLPKIARLSLSIVKANRCSIKLADRGRKVLLPKTTVDLRKKKVRLKKVKVGMHGPGRAFKKAKSIRGRSYLSTPLIDEDVIGVITLYDKLDGENFSRFDQEIMETLAEQAVIAIKNAQLYKEQEKLIVGTIKSLCSILEARFPGMISPKTSFVRIVLEMGKAFRLKEYELRSLQYATLLHDAGEITVPDEILSKPSRLTGKEFSLVKEHPLRSVNFLKPLKALKEAWPIILYHHEKYDGTGYPKGLKGKQIPLGARIMAVAAAFEAMIARRPYRAKKSVKKALNEIKKNSGTQFDPKVVDVFLRVIKKKYILSLLKKEGYC